MNETWVKQYRLLCRPLRVYPGIRTIYCLFSSRHTFCHPATHLALPPIILSCLAEVLCGLIGPPVKNAYCLALPFLFRMTRHWLPPARGTVVGSRNLNGTSNEKHVDSSEERLPIRGMGAGGTMRNPCIYTYTKYILYTSKYEVYLYIICIC